MIKARLLRALLLVAVPAALTVAPTPAFANNLCGFVITVPGTYVMPHDHTCTAGTAITVQSDDVTIDLNGFRLSGQGNTAEGILIDSGPGFENVSIMNGVIRGFETGIEGGNCLPIAGLGVISNITMQDLTVRNSTTHGIRLCKADGTNAITNTVVVGAADQGIEVEGPVTITNSVVRDTGDGMRLVPEATSSETVTVTGSLVEDVATTAIELSAIGSTGFLALADISDTTISGAARGITTSGDLWLEASGLSIRETANEAIDLTASTTAGTGAPFSIEDTTITAVGGGVLGGAIVVQDRPGTGTIAGTTINGVEDAPGILVACSSHAVIVEDSVIKNADEEGVLVTDASSVDGVACQNVLRPTAVIVNGTLIRANGGTGASFLTGRAHSVAGSVFRANGGDGVFMDSDVTESFLTDNLARRNADDGFQLDTADLELTENLAQGNTGYGFETNFVGPVLVDNGQTSRNNGAGNCSDPSDLPNTNC